VLVEGSLDPVLDVLRRDDAAVLVLDTLLDLVSPGLGAVTWLAKRLGQVGDRLIAVRAVRRREQGQRWPVQPDEDPRVTAVGVGRVERVAVAGVGKPERATLLVRGIEHLANPGVVRCGGTLGFGRFLRPVTARKG